MAAPGPFGVIGVDGAALEGGQRRLDEARLVEGIGVDGHLHVQLVRHGQAIVDGRWGGPPVLMEFEPDGTGQDLFAQWLGEAHVALANEAEVHGEGVCGLEHGRQVPGARGAGGGVGPGGRARAAAQHRRDAGH